MGSELFEEFRERGIVRVPGAFTSEQAAAMRRTVWRYAERRAAIKIDEPATWRQPTVLSFKPLKARPVFAPFLDNCGVTSALDTIFGAGGWAPPKKPGGHVMLTFPRPGPWILPTGWHMDWGFDTPTWPVPSVKLFAFLDEVQPEGGGTLVLSGSHRLVERYRATLPPGTPGNSSTWGKFMAQDDWLRELRNGATQAHPLRERVNMSHVVDGIELELNELTGAPGDVVITHIHVFHCAAPNVLDTPRQMLGGFVRTA